MDAGTSTLARQGRGMEPGTFSFGREGRQMEHASLHRGGRGSLRPRNPLDRGDAGAGVGARTRNDPRLKRAVRWKSFSLRREKTTESADSKRHTAKTLNLKPVGGRSHPPPPQMINRACFLFKNYNTSLRSKSIGRRRRGSGSSSCTRCPSSACMCLSLLNQSVLTSCASPNP